MKKGVSRSTKQGTEDEDPNQVQMVESMATLMRERADMLERLRERDEREERLQKEREEREDAERRKAEITRTGSVTDAAGVRGEETQSRSEEKGGRQTGQVGGP